MKQIIKITDIESGKELEIVSDKCKNCFYNNSFNCPIIDEKCVLADNNTMFKGYKQFIFKEVTKKEENESK